MTTVMALEKEVYSSDTLERSNLSSLQSDLSAEKKSDMNSTKVNLNKIQNCFCQQELFGNMKCVPCPILNSNFDTTQYYRQCLCQRFQLNESDFRKQKDDDNVKNEWQRFNWKWPRHSYANKKDKSYDIKSKYKKYFRPEEPVACCDVLQGIPRRKSSGLKNILENPMKNELDSKDESEIAEKIEIYYFDHGNSAYYHTTDMPPVVTSEKICEKSNTAAVRFWAEIFGYAHIVASFITSFILQLIRCLLFSIVRPLSVGVIQLIADYFIKPLLSITFNGLIQPILILFYNMATSLRDCCEPLATALGYFMKEVAMLFRSCRLVEITHNNNANT